MALSLGFVAVVVLVAGVAAAPSEDVSAVGCSLELVSRWPEDVSSEKLAFAANTNADNSGPLYRLVSEVDVRNVQPLETYKVSLASVAPGVNLHRFFIWIESESKCGAGRIKSLSDESEHVSYRCDRYLVERSNDLVGFHDVPFLWEAPKCGCIEISAHVLDEHNYFYVHDNDQFRGLKMKACVEEKEEVAEVIVEAEPSEDAPCDEDTEEKEQDKEEFLDYPGESNSISASDYSDDEIEKGDGDDEDMMFGDDPTANSGRKKRKNKAGKRNLSEEEKKQLRKKGKRFCCKRGISAKEDNASCDAAADQVLRKASRKFELQKDKCSEVFAECCKDETKLSAYKEKKGKNKKRKN